MTVAPWNALSLLQASLVIPSHLPILNIAIIISDSLVYCVAASPYCVFQYGLDSAQHPIPQATRCINLLWLYCVAKTRSSPASWAPLCCRARSIVHCQIKFESFFLFHNYQQSTLSKRQDFVCQQKYVLYMVPLLTRIFIRTSDVLVFVPLHCIFVCTFVLAVWYFRRCSQPEVARQS